MTCWPADYPESLTPWSIGSVPPHQVKHLLEQLELILVPNAAVNDTSWRSTQKLGPNAWAIWSGTSFSAVQIAGTVARLCQLNPDPITPLDAL